MVGLSLTSMHCTRSVFNVGCFAMGGIGGFGFHHLRRFVDPLQATPHLAGQFWHFHAALEYNNILYNCGVSKHEHLENYVHTTSSCT